MEIKIDFWTYQKHPPLSEKKNLTQNIFAWLQNMLAKSLGVYVAMLQILCHII